MLLIDADGKVLFAQSGIPIPSGRVRTITEGVPGHDAIHAGRITRAAGAGVFASIGDLIAACVRDPQPAH